MLTATYALVALSVEQSSVRSSLSALQKSIKNYLSCQQEGDEIRVEFLLKKIARLHHRCQWRKVDIYLIPALRKVTRKADQVLAELESLSLLGLSLLRSIRNRLARAITQRCVKWEDLSGAIELYCNTLLKKLEKEERELFPVARREIPQGEWFSIAEKFLLHDASEREPVRQRYTGILPHSTVANVIGIQASMQTTHCRMLNRTRILPKFIQEMQEDVAVQSYIGMPATSRMVYARL